MASRRLMVLPWQFVRRDRMERGIALARVALACTALLAIWLDPAEPQRFVSVTYGLHASYVAYAALLAVVFWRREAGSRFLIGTHVVDIVIGSVFQYLTMGPSSPLFMYFTFALASSAVRWGSRGTLRTAGLVITSYVVMAVSLSQVLSPGEFELNRFIIRIAYLTMVAAVLVYLGRYEEQLRGEMTLLARWPVVDVGRPGDVIPAALAHAAGIVQAREALLLWSRDDEPWLYLVAHPGAAMDAERLAPAVLDPPVADDLVGPFYCIGSLDDATTVRTSREGRVVTWTGKPVHEGLRRRLAGRALAATPFRTDHVSGWVLFVDPVVSGVEALPLLEVIGREVGGSIDHALAYARGRELAVTEDRITRARDLHDGILQSLTGVRLELQAMATGREPTDSRRLLALEHALAVEQRDLRRVIDGHESEAEAGTLAARLEELGRRMTFESRAPISIQVHPPDLTVPDRLTRAVTLLTHEAISNALRHALPTRVTVGVAASNQTLTIEVRDDGRGFPFLGRRTHDDLSASGEGPLSLRERVASLGGSLSVESAPTGSRVMLALPLEPVHAA